MEKELPLQFDIDEQANTSEMSGSESTPQAQKIERSSAAWLSFERHIGQLAIKDLPKHPKSHL